MPERSVKCRVQGFTLLEILAALAITVIGIAAVVKAAGSAVDLVQTTEDRILGSWVASNRLEELRLSRDWPAAATRDFSETYGGREWYYRERVSTTADPDLLRVDISVYSDKEHLDLSAEMFGYISRYSPPSTTPLPWLAELRGESQDSGRLDEGSSESPLVDGRDANTEESGE
jgi:general secretion pathway protein I